MARDKISSLYFDLDNMRMQPPTLILCTRSMKRIGVIANAFPSLIWNFNAADEMTFRVYRYVGDSECRVWDDIDNLKLVYLKEINEYFQIEISPSEEKNVYKDVICTSLCESELSQVYIYNTEINTEDDIARDDYTIPTVFYNPNYPSASLLHRVLDKVPHYTIGHVDSTLWNIQRTFSFDGETIYDVLTGEISEQIGCIFQFDSTTRTINVYDTMITCHECGARFDENLMECPECGSTNISEPYGVNTQILFCVDNIAELLQIDYAVDEYKNCLRIKSGDDLMDATIRSINPNGSLYIYNITELMYNDMSDELKEKLEEYNELYNSIMVDFQPEFDETVKEEYNALVAQYNTSRYANYKYDDDGYRTLQNNSFRNLDNITGYSDLTEIYFDAIDFESYLADSLLPAYSLEYTTAENEIEKLTSTSLSPIGLSSMSSSTSSATIESAIKSYVKLLVTGSYKVTVETESYEYNGLNSDGYYAGTWKGYITLESYSSDLDCATTGLLTLIVNDDYELYITQKIEKSILEDDNDTYSGSIYNIMTIEYTEDDSEFIAALKLYNLASLKSYRSAYQSAMDILIEMDQASEAADLYYMYKEYKQRYDEIDAEIEVRTNEIGIVDDLLDNIESIRDVIHVQLDMEGFLGEKLWKELCAYIREDTYENSNYISDGLSNTQLVANANALYELAYDQLRKVGAMGISITGTLINFMALEEFRPLVANPYYLQNLVESSEELMEDAKGNILIGKGGKLNYQELMDATRELLEDVNDDVLYTHANEIYNSLFDVGVWVRVKFDGTVYKVRVASIEIDFDDLTKCNVTFSDVLQDYKSTTQKMLEQANGLATSMTYIESQTEQNKESTSVVTDWITDGLQLTNYSIMSDSNNQNVTYDKNGILVRSYDDVADAYNPTQLKINNSTIAITDDRWNTVRAAIGKFYYRHPGTNTMTEAYGINAETLVGNLIIGTELGIYSEDGSSIMSFDNNGLVLNSISDSSGYYKRIFDVQIDGNSVLYVNSQGNLVVEGTIYAGDGQIGGWTIDDDSIYRNSSTWASSSGMYFGVDGLSITNKFYVDSDGNLTATSANITGTINATSGSFSGTITASSGTIGGWSIGSSAIYRNSSTWGNSSGMYFGTNGLSIGSAFTVNSSGELNATGANISGTITATSGFIGGFTINSNSLSTSFTVTYDFTSSDRTTIQNIIMNGTTPTQAQLDRYDLNGNGIIESSDYAICGNIINAGNKVDVTFTIDPNAGTTTDLIVIENSSSSNTTRIGSRGYISAQFITGSNIYSNDIIMIDDGDINMGYGSIYGNSNTLITENSSNATVIGSNNNAGETVLCSGAGHTMRIRPSGRCYVYRYDGNLSTSNTGQVFTISTTTSYTNDGTSNSNIVFTSGCDSTSPYIRSYATYDRTYDSSANIHITSSGTFGTYSSSSIRYKNSVKYFTNEENMSDEVISAMNNDSSVRKSAMSTEDSDDITYNDFRNDMRSILDLPVVKFHFNEGYVNGEPDYDYGQYVTGFIAEDVYKNVPEAADFNDDGEIETWNINKLFPRAVWVLQEHDNRIEELEKENESLRNRIDKLENSLS